MATVRTKEEMIAFRKEWDRKYEVWCDKMRVADPNWVPPVLETIR